jgi:hypothetical protein
MSLGYGGTDVAHAAPPSHDDFDSARLITGIEYQDVNVDTTEATPDVDDPTDDPDNIPCEGDTLNAGFATVWYKYRPPETQSLTLNTFGTTYDTFIAVWRGSRGSLIPVACNDETFDVHQSEVSFVATGGITYFIEIGQFNSGTPGTPTIGGTLDFHAFITNTTLRINNTIRGRYFVPESGNTRRNLINLNAGPVEIFNVASNQLVASERVIYNARGRSTSFSEMMGLPANQVFRAYRLPWYTNNQIMDTQLRIANVSGATASIRVWIGGQLMGGGPFPLAPGTVVFKAYPGIDRGPVRIVSTANIVVSERVFYKVNGVNASFSELMALPENRLNKVYWLPWYNNTAMTTQLQISNVSSFTATIRVSIGGQLMPGSPFTLARGRSIRLAYPGVDRGPVRILSNVKILASERVIFRANGLPVSFSEMMALPANQLDTIYWLPVYTKNANVNTQLQLANVSSSTARIHIYMGGVEVAGSPFNLAPMRSIRKAYNVDKGPVRIESTVKIIASARVIYTAGGQRTSYSEMMALPNRLLDSRYWMTWYNNKTMNTQFRFALP